jgi:hypothetical protein
MPKKYTYNRLSDYDLRRLRPFGRDVINRIVDPADLITEILELRKQLKNMRQMGMVPSDYHVMNGRQ